MKAFGLLIGILLFAALPTKAQEHPLTARQYFTELRDAKALNHYSDIYVCFRDDDTPSFAVVADLDDIRAELIRTGDEKKLKAVGNVKGLFVQTYYKGVANGPTIFDKVSDGKYSYNFDLPSPRQPARMTYLINWKTGRYRLKIYVFEHGVTVPLPVMESSGKCELIHPWEKP